MPTISGTVRDSAGNPLSNRAVRAYRRDSGDLLAASQSSDGSGLLPVGQFQLVTSYTGACTAVVLDEGAGNRNALVFDRVTPV